MEKCTLKKRGDLPPQDPVETTEILVRRGKKQSKKVLALLSSSEQDNEFIILFMTLGRQATVIPLAGV